jgi:hypothetical protein
MLRVSCALCPSKFSPVVTPCSAPLSCWATGSGTELRNGARAGRGAGCCCDALAPLAFAEVMSRSGADRSWRAALITVGVAARARGEKRTRDSKTGTENKFARFMHTSREPSTEADAGNSLVQRVRAGNWLRSPGNGVLARYEPTTRSPLLGMRFFSSSRGSRLGAVGHRFPDAVLILINP